MTVEELVQVLDKKSRFIIRVCHTDKTIFHPVKDEEKWEMFRRKEVVQFTPVEDGIIIYVAPPVGKDSQLYITQLLKAMIASGSSPGAERKKDGE